MTQFQTTLPTVLTEQFKEHSSVDTLKVFAQDEPAWAYCLSSGVALRPVASSLWPP